MKIKRLNEEVSKDSSFNIREFDSLINGLEKYKDEAYSLWDKTEDEYIAFRKVLDKAEESEEGSDDLDRLYDENDRLVQNDEDAKWYYEALDEHIKTLRSAYSSLESIVVEWNEDMCKRFPELTKMGDM